MFLTVHSYRTLTIDEVAKAIVAWEESVLELWEEKPNLAENEAYVHVLYTRSSGLIQPLYKYLQQIAIALLENTSEKGINIDEVISITRTARVNI